LLTPHTALTPLIFTQNLALSDYDIIVPTETWLSSDIIDAELGLSSNYQIYRCDHRPIKDLYSFIGL